MKTNVSSTSLDAYHSLGVADYLQPKERLGVAIAKTVQDAINQRMHV